MTKSHFLSRAAHWRLGGALLTLLVASQAAADFPVPRPVNKCDCGPIDVAFVVDDTGSMGTALNAFKTSFPGLVSRINTASGGDYRMGLITFKDNVTVREPLNPGNSAVMTTLINSLTASAGAGGPEASDEALNTAIHNLAVRPGQTGSFSNIWRTGARRFVVLITDNLPGGFNDLYTAGVDDVHAHQMALDAYTDEIAIHAIFSTGASTPSAQVVTVMQDYANTSRGLYRLTRPNASDMLQALQDFMSGCRQPSDVYIKDDAADTGIEPSTANPIYLSPDIKICTNANGCAAPGVNPVYGSNNNHVFVTLRNSGPKVVPSGPVGGSLYVYYTTSGTSALWPNNWTLINVEHGIYMTPNEVREVRLKWNNVPLPAHYCLMARWVSQGDPMSYPELMGSLTVTNTRQNNNIAWRNINVVNTTPGGTTGGGVVVRDVDFLPATFDIRPDGIFPGKIAVDLGPTLFEAWVAGGRKGTGISPVGGTVLMVSPEGGSIQAVTLPKGGEASFGVTFSVNADAEARVHPVLISQLGGDGKTDVGGVRWDVNVLAADAPAVAPSLSAVRNAEGVVELAWTHTVHHKAYRIWRMDTVAAATAGAGQVIAEVPADGATELEALRFTDFESQGRAFTYMVESLAPAGSAFSEQASADPVNNK